MSVRACIRKLFLLPLLWIVTTACRLPTIEPALFQPISPIAPTAAAQAMGSQITLADIQSFHVDWSTGSIEEQIHLQADWVRADHDWGFDLSFQLFMPGADDFPLMKGYLIGDSAYGHTMAQPFAADPRQVVVGSLPFPTDLLLYSGFGSEPRIDVAPSDQAVAISPFFMTQIPFATIAAQAASVSNVEIDGMPAIHYQLSGLQALSLLEPALRTSPHLAPSAEPAVVQGEFWFTTDLQHLLRYVIKAEGTHSGGTPFTIHEEYMISAINQVPPISLPAEAQAQVAKSADMTAATLIVPAHCPSCIFPKPAGVPVTSNPMSAGRFANFQLPVEARGPDAALADYEAQLMALGWQISSRTAREERGWIYRTWSVTNGIRTFGVSGRSNLAANQPMIAIEIATGAPYRWRADATWSAVPTAHPGQGSTPFAFGIATAHRDGERVAQMGFNWMLVYDPPHRREPVNVLYRVPVQHDAYDPTNAESRHDFEQQLYKLAGEHGHWIEAYEIGNEVNLAADGWGTAPDPRAYVDLLCTASAVLKQMDPTAIIISAGLAPVGRVQGEWNGYRGHNGSVQDERVYFREFLAAGGGECADAFGYHPMGFRAGFAAEPDRDGGTPATNCANGFCFRNVEQIRSIAEAMGYGYKQIWATEVGWLVAPADTTCLQHPSWHGRAWQSVSQREQAENLSGALRYAYKNRTWFGALFLFNLNFHAAPYYHLCEQMRYYSVQDTETELVLTRTIVQVSLE